MVNTKANRIMAVVDETDFLIVLKVDSRVEWPGSF